MKVKSQRLNVLICKVQICGKIHLRDDRAMKKYYRNEYREMGAFLCLNHQRHIKRDRRNTQQITQREMIQAGSPPLTKRKEKKEQRDRRIAGAP